MTKNEYIASIMLDAADLLREDDTEYDSMNEDALASISIIALIPLGVISFYLFYEKIKNLINRSKVKNKILKKGREAVLTEFNEIHKGWKLVAKLAKQGKVTISCPVKIMEYIDRAYTFNTKYSNQIKNLDNELANLGSADEFERRVKDFEQKYTKLNDAMQKDIKFLNSILSSVDKSDVYTDQNGIISFIDRLLSQIQDQYYRDADSSDYCINRFNWLGMLESNSESHGDWNRFHKILQEVQEIFGIVDCNMINDYIEYSDIYKAIKIRKSQNT